MTLRRTLAGAAVLLMLSGTALGADAARRAMLTAASDLANENPDVRFATVKDRVSAVYGPGMVVAATPRAAADLWVESFGEVFGAERPELVVKRENTLPMTDSGVVVYDQTIDGMPVEQGRLRVVTKPVGGQSEVALVNGRLARRPEAGWAPLGLSGPEAIEQVATHPLYRGLQEFRPAELVVYFGEGDAEDTIEPVRAWKFAGLGQGPAGPLAFYFFVDASTGALLHARNEIHNENVTGAVRGFATPGTLPDSESNAPVLTALPDVRVTSSGAAAVFTGPTGAFVSTGNPAAAVTIASGVVSGRWISINNSAGAEITASAVVSAPGSIDLVLNTTPTEANTAQVNAILHQTLAHNYFRERAPTFTGLDISLPSNVNVASTCNANFDGISIQTNFFNAGGGCVNTAYSAVVAHEYGHFIVNRLGLAQGAFGEGFGDTMSMMLYDDFVLGRDFRGPGTFVRNPVLANQQYPCASTAIHTCGQILAGVLWEIRTNFGQSYGEPTAFELVRQLHVDWALITDGGIGLNSAHPQTAVEFLTADDDDANINNGTPNIGDICAAFLSRGIPCPQLDLIQFDYPLGRPQAVVPSGGTPLIVAISARNAAPIAGTATLFVSIDNAPFQAFPLSEGENGQFVGVFPAAPCGAPLRYYVQVNTSTAGEVRSPFDAPLASFSTTAATAVNTVVNDTVEVESGWSLSIPSDTATTGRWVRVDPVGTAAQPENDVSDPGTFCFVTGQGVVGGALGDADVDGGTTTLTSPAIDLSGAQNARLSYSRWYSNSAGAAPNADTFVVQISNNNSTWVTVETVGPIGPETAGGWFRKTFDVADFVTPSADVRVRFIASDIGSGSVIEAAVDELTITDIICAAPVSCPGDADGNLVVNFSDVTTVLANFGSAGPLGDANESGTVDFSDVTTVLANFGATCN